MNSLFPLVEIGESLEGALTFCMSMVFGVTENDSEVCQETCFFAKALAFLVFSP